MRTTISVIITFLVMTGYSFAQTYEPTQVGFRYHYSGSPILLDQHPDFRQDSSFIIGWYWYHGKKMSKALGVNLVTFLQSIFGQELLVPIIGFRGGAEFSEYGRFPNHTFTIIGPALVLKSY